MTADHVLLEVNDGIAVMTLNDGARMNPLGQEIIGALRAAVVQASADAAVRAIVLTGSGRAFSVGADLSHYDAMLADPTPMQTPGAHIGDLMAQLNAVIEGFKTLAVPVVVAINGVAAGGGAGLALAGDMAIAARSAYFYLPFLPALGVVPDMAVSWTMDRTIGRARSMGLALTGNRLSAEQAANWGLIWACVDDDRLRDEALALARQLAAMPPHAVIVARALFASAEARSLGDHLAYERSRQMELADGDSFAEGVRAFTERRRPVFRS
jgi:2-(1,2-epoxy-1,2-dihydrophenyl)acetyl-CoA isomerase